MQFQKQQHEYQIQGKNKSYHLDKLIKQDKELQVYHSEKTLNEAILVYKNMKVDERNFITEIANQEFKHFTNIIEFIEGEFDESYIIIEYSEVNLGDLIKKQDINQEQVKDFIIQIIQGVQELHNINIIHKDINPKNILVFQAGNDKNLTLKLWSPNIIELSNQITSITSQYSIDIWALGLTWFELLSKQQLFDYPSKDKIPKKMTQQQIDKQIDQLLCCGQQVDERNKKLLKRMICIENDLRFNAQQVLQTLYGSDKHFDQQFQYNKFEIQQIKSINAQNHEQKIIKKYLIQQLELKQKSYKNKLNLYNQQVENINQYLKKEFCDLIEFKSSNYQNQLVISKNFLEKLQKIVQFYLDEQQQFNSRLEEQKIGLNQIELEKQLKEVEQQYENLISKIGQIARDQDKVEELKQEQKLIQDEYYQKLNIKQEQVQELKQKVSERFDKKLKLLTFVKEDIMNNRMMEIDEVCFQNMIQQLNNDLNQQQTDFREKCKLSSLKLQQTLSEYIIQYEQIIKILEYCNQMDQELTPYDQNQFQQNIIIKCGYQSKNKTAYSQNKVKLRAKIKNSQLIMLILRIQDEKKKNYQQEIKNICLSQYDKLISQIYI